MMKNAMTKKRGGSVAIIGAGAAGLVAARELCREGLDVTIFESSAEVGGTWVYTDDIETHSSMYQSLKTNLPKYVMQYRNVPFDDEIPSFPSRKQVAQYLEKFASDAGVFPLIQFNTRVVQANIEASDLRWNVQYQPKEAKTVSEKTFDKLVVCNGHYTRPFIPLICGIDHFSGLVLHTHNYRKPDGFRDKTVVVVGNAASGQDISRELCFVAKTVYIVYPPPHLHATRDTEDGRIHKPLIRSITADGVIVFEDESTCEADVLLFATGYVYDFSFLPSSLFPELPKEKEKGLIESVGRVVYPLYKHVFHIEYPTLALVGIPFTCIPFLCSELQARWVARVFAGTLALPNKETMYKECHEYLNNVTRVEKFHQLADKQTNYYNELGELLNESISPIISEMYDDAWYLRRYMPHCYRHAKYSACFDTNRWSRVIEINGEKYVASSEKRVI